MQTATCRVLVLSLFLFLASSVQAQQTRAKRLDSLYNDPFFFSTVSAIILPKGFVEVNTFTSLSSASQLFNNWAQREEINARQSQLTSLLQFTCGTSASSRFNIGADLSYSRQRLAVNPNGSFWNLFGSDSAYVNEASLKQAGVHVRWKPFARDRNLLIQAGVYIPLYKPADNQTQVQVQVIRVYELGRRLFLYAQPGLTYSLPKPAIRGTVSIPLTALLQYQIRPRLGLLCLLNHTMGFKKEAGVFGQSSWVTQVGGGLQFQPSLQLGFTAFATQHLAGRKGNVSQTVNLGVRVII